MTDAAKSETSPTVEGLLEQVKELRQQVVAVQHAFLRAASGIEKLQFEKAGLVGIVGMMCSALQESEALAPDCSTRIVQFVQQWASAAPEPAKGAVLLTLTAFQDAAQQTRPAAH